MRATVEQVAGNLGGRSDPEATSGAGRHGGAVESGPGGDDADFLEIEQFARLKRIARKPGPVLFLVLLLVSLVACRDLLGGGALAGGALLPAPADAVRAVGALPRTPGIRWAPAAPSPRRPTSRSSRCSPPRCSARPASPSPSCWSCSVPLAGFTAYFASRPLVESRLLRAWAAVVYAFLPAATGALAGGRIGTAVLAVLLPLMARAGIAASGLATRVGRARQLARHLGVRAAADDHHRLHARSCGPSRWSSASRSLVVRRGEITAYGLRFLAQLGTPLAGPRALVADPAARSASSRRPVWSTAPAPPPPSTCSAPAPAAPARSSGLMLIGVVLAALAALLRTERQFGDLDRLGGRPGRPRLRGPRRTARPGPAPPPSSTASPCWPPPRSAPTAHARAWPSRASAGASRSPH